MGMHEKDLIVIQEVIQSFIETPDCRLIFLRDNTYLLEFIDTGLSHSVLRDLVIRLGRAGVSAMLERTSYNSRNNYTIMIRNLTKKLAEKLWKSQSLSMTPEQLKSLFENANNIVSQCVYQIDGRTDCRLWSSYPNGAECQLEFSKPEPQEDYLKRYAEHLKERGLLAKYHEANYSVNLPARVIIYNSRKEIIDKLNINNQSKLIPLSTPNSALFASQFPPSASLPVVQSLNARPTIAPQSSPLSSSSYYASISVASAKTEQADIIVQSLPYGFSMRVAEKKLLNKSDQLIKDTDEAMQKFLCRLNCKLWCPPNNESSFILTFKDPQPTYVELNNYYSWIFNHTDLSVRILNSGKDSGLQPYIVNISNSRDTILFQLNKYQQSKTLKPPSAPQSNPIAPPPMSLFQSEMPQVNAIEAPVLSGAAPLLSKNLPKLDNEKNNSPAKEELALTLQRSGSPIHQRAVVDARVDEQREDDKSYSASASMVLSKKK